MWPHDRVDACIFNDVENLNPQLIAVGATIKWVGKV